MFRTALLFVSALLLSSGAPAWAQSASAPQNAANAGTVGIISGGADGTYIRIAADLANVLDGETLRIIPMIGRGSLQNLRDILYLRGVDVGIVQMDARQGLQADSVQKAAQDRLRYIARLYNEELHVLASTGIADIRQLEGRKVNIDKPGSGTNLTARLVFEKLGIQPDFTEDDQAKSLERLRSGELDAALYVAGRPVRAFTEFRSDGKFHLLSVPFEGEIAQNYLPATFSTTDYPNLVQGGKEVETLAIGNVLAVFNWPENSERYKRVQRFVDAFFSRFDEFSAPGRHPKWKEVSLSATVPGWQRFKAAQDWLDRSAQTTATASTDQAREFGRFVSTRVGPSASASPAEMERLFREFLATQKAERNRRAGGVQ
jgi:uncharacterized protein